MEPCPPEDRPPESCVPAPAETPWEDLLERFGPALRARVALALGRAGMPLEPDDVEEAVQESWCRLLSRGSAFLHARSDAEICRFLARVADSTVLDRWREVTAVKRGGYAVRLDVDAAAGAADPGADPEERAIWRERHRLFLDRCRLHASMVGKPKAERRNVWILERVLIHGWTSREVADAVGGRFSASAVDTVIHRVRHRLAEEGFRLPCRVRGATHPSADRL
jgi:DNA-directed RNA polymerase specialized sigma24 family protein